MGRWCRGAVVLEKPLTAWYLCVQGIGASAAVRHGGLLRD